MRARDEQPAAGDAEDHVGAVAVVGDRQREVARARPEIVPRHHLAFVAHRDEPNQRRGERIDGQRDVLRARELVRMVLRRRRSGCARRASSCWGRTSRRGPRPRRGAARPGAPRRTRRPSAPGRTATARSKPIRSISASSSAAVGGARVDGDRHLLPARRSSRSARPRSRRPSRRCPERAHVAHVEDEPRRLDERVGARVHRRRPGVVGASLEHLEAARLAGDRRHDAERLAEAREHRPLLDVQLEIGVGDST